MKKHVARKRFGQNFLIDRGVIERIVTLLDPRPGEIIVEIGPGQGALTRPIALRLAPELLHVVELDRDLARVLGERIAPARVSLHEADALEFDFRALVGESGQRLRVVGNLPYNISSPLLFHLTAVADIVSDQQFMLQKEVVDRMVAAPGTTAFGRLSVMLQVRYRMEHVFDVPPESFDPAPKVDSAIVRMVPVVPRPIVADPLFGAVVARAFATRRKMLRNALGEFDQIVRLTDSGIDPAARAEDIAPDAYADYVESLRRAGVAA